MDQSVSDTDGACGCYPEDADFSPTLVALCGGQVDSGNWGEEK